MLGKQGVIHLAVKAPKLSVYSDPRFPPSIYYRFLYLLAYTVKPKVSVELGLCGGGGSLHLALGHPAGKVIGIDNRVEYPDNLKHIREKCPNFEFWRGDSVDAARRADQTGPLPVDILFIDTIHTYERTMEEFDAWHPLMAEKGIVVLDDLHREGMQEAWDDLPGREKIRLDLLHLGGAPTDGGFGVILL